MWTSITDQTNGGTLYQGTVLQNKHVVDAVAHKYQANAVSSMLCTNYSFFLTERLCR